MKKEYLYGFIGLSIIVVLYVKRNSITKTAMKISDNIINTIIAFVIKMNEGGYVSAEKAKQIGDTGGETNFGISKKAFPNLDIKNLTIEKAAQIYKDKYYKPIAHIPFDSANMFYQIFDMGINAGPGTAAKLWKPGMTVKDYQTARLNKYKKMKLWNYEDPKRKGYFPIRVSWTNRVNRTV